VTTVRHTYLQVILDLTILSDVISARGEVAADSGWPTCSVFLHRYPYHLDGPPATPIDEENDIQVDAGAGNNVTRFFGRLRRFRPSAFPKGIELVCMGKLAYANEWSPAEQILFDDAWPTGATDQQLIMDALDHVPQLGPTSYSSGDILGTSIVLGLTAPDNFNWDPGTTAWSRIQAIDQATLYRTYQTQDGTIKRVKMIGHPNNTPDFTLGEHDALDGTKGERNTEQTRNAVVVQGATDPKDGPARGLALASNGFQGSASDPTTRYPSKFSSPMIEDGNDEDGDPLSNTGLNAQTIAGEVILDVNKEFVDATVPSWRDDTHGPGMTATVDLLARIRVGEPMWVAKYAWEISDQGWQSTYTMTGGGLPQTYTTPEV